MFHKFIIKEFSISVIFHHNLLKWEISSKRTSPFLFTMLCGYKLLRLLFSHSAIFLFTFSARIFFPSHWNACKKFIHHFGCERLNAVYDDDEWKIIYPRGKAFNIPMKSCHVCMQLTHSLSPWLIYRIFYVKLYIPPVPLSA